MGTTTANTRSEMGTSSDLNRGDVSTGDQRSVHAVLVAARKLIEKPEHWCQGRYHIGEASCAEGAVLSVTSEYDDTQTNIARAGAFAALDRAVGGYIVDFNDAPGRTHSEVLAVFDKAIEAQP